MKMNSWSDDPTQPSSTPSGGFPPLGSPSGNMSPYGPPLSGGLPPHGPPPTGMPPGGSPLFYRYHPALLALLAGLFLFALVILCPLSGIVRSESMSMLVAGAYMSVFLGTIVCVLILDWRGFFSVRGLFPWQRWPIIARL